MTQFYSDRLPSKTVMTCASCGAVLACDEVDIGVGIQHGPWYCTECGWKEVEEFGRLKSDWGEDDAGT